MREEPRRPRAVPSDLAKKAEDVVVVARGVRAHRVASTGLSVLKTPGTFARSWAAISGFWHAPRSPHRRPVPANRAGRR